MGFLGQRFFSVRKKTPRAEFDPKALADFRVTEWDPTHLLMELYRTSSSYFHRSRLRKEGMLETLNLGQTRPGIFRRYKRKYLFVSDSTVTCYQTQPADVNQTKPKIKVALLINDLANHLFDNLRFCCRGTMNQTLTRRRRTVTLQAFLPTA